MKGTCWFDIEREMKRRMKSPMSNTIVSQEMLGLKICCFTLKGPDFPPGVECPRSC